jgi:hypothetical protein
MIASMLLPSTTALRIQARYAKAPKRSQAIRDRCIGLSRSNLAFRPEASWMVTAAAEIKRVQPS